MIPVFYLEATDRCKMYLRRYIRGECPLVPGKHSYHNAKVFIGEGPHRLTVGDPYSHDDERWPTECGCGHVFGDNGTWQLFASRIYRRFDTKEEMVLCDAPAGAYWNDSEMAKRRTAPDFYIGDDDKCLVIRTPGGDWYVDSRASNCTMPDDTTHKCWVRHGGGEDSTTPLHVDKQGHTCGAGAGSIVMGSYHGFCHSGFLLEC
jgi:hypothetical protein